jgi:hypothetical protein
VSNFDFVAAKSLIDLAAAQTTSSQTIVLSVVIILRMTATITTFGFFPAA